MDDGAGGTLRKTVASRLKTYIGGSDPASADGDTLGTASLEWSDLYLADGGVIYFGNDQDVTVTHSADSGLLLKHVATVDDKPINLVLQTGETDMAANDVIGKISFQAPDEGTGTDAVLISAAIQARSEGDFAADANATSIDFMTGASEAAATKWSITSAGSFLNAGTNTIDMNAGELILDADADTSITADTDDQIDIRIAGADDFQFTANTFTAQSGSTIAAQALTAAGLITTSAGIKADDGSTSTPSLHGTTSTNAGIFFPAADHMAVGIGGSELARFGSNSFMLNETANADSTVGITINQGGQDDEIFALKSSDVAHGMTVHAETDTFFGIVKTDAGAGGANIEGWTEATKAIQLQGYFTTADTTKSHTGNCAITAYPVIKDGSNIDTVGADANCFGVLGTLGHTQFIVDSDGDVHYDGSTNATAWDDYDDVELLDTFRSLTVTDKDAAKNIFGNFIDAHAKVLNDTGVITLNEDGHHFVSTKGLNGLLIDSIRQTNARMKTIVNAVEEMMPGFSDKLNQKLEAQELPALPV